MRQTKARKCIRARAVGSRSKSRANRRNLAAQAKDLFTTQRRGKRTKP